MILDLCIVTKFKPTKLQIVPLMLLESIAAASVTCTCNERSDSMNLAISRLNTASDFINALVDWVHFLLCWQSVSGR